MNCIPLSFFQMTPIIGVTRWMIWTHKKRKTRRRLNRLSSTFCCPAPSVLFWWERHLVIIYISSSLILTGLLLPIFTISTQISPIRNMFPPRRASWCFLLLSCMQWVCCSLLLMFSTFLHLFSSYFATQVLGRMYVQFYTPSYLILHCWNCGWN